MSNNSNGGVRFCQDCGERLHPGHSRTCKGRVPPAQAPRQPQGPTSAEVAALARRLAALEARPTAPLIGTSVEDMRLPASGQPAGTVNRLFCIRFHAVASAAATGLVRVGATGAEWLTIDGDMPGFSEWSTGYSSVSVSAVSVVYQPTLSGAIGSGGVFLAFERASRGNPNATEITRVERSLYCGAPNAGQLRVPYLSRTPFERYLVGTPARNRDTRAFGRVHVFRESTGYVNPAAQTFAGNLGLVYVYVQCACRRESV